MILIIAVVLGTLIGLSRAIITRQRIEIPRLTQQWLVAIAFLPQFLAFFLIAARDTMPDTLASMSLVLSQILLLWFVWKNRKQSGFWLLGSGLLLNFLVIVINGGFMPINPDTVQQLIPDAPTGSWEIGSRFGTGKDIVLPISDTKLWWLSDIFLLPDWFRYKVAFSVGDVLIALGTILFLGDLGAPGKINTERMEHANVSNILAR